MKKIIISFTVIVSLFFLYSCVRTEAVKPPDVTAGSLMVDVTDHLSSLPDVGGIEDQYSGLKADHTTGAIFHGITLSDVQYTPETDVVIQPESYMLSNPGQRKIAVDDFFNRLDQAVTRLRAVPEGKPYSDLYVPIATEANRLMTVPASTRFLIVYSNLYENSYFSMYQAGDLDVLADHPEQVAALFQQRMPLQNLKGLHVYFLYQPTDYDDSQLYAQISNVYQQMFENAGAIVTISANLPNQ